MRALRNIAIIALIAVPVAFLPGGGAAARAVVAALGIGFLASIGFAGWQGYRANQFTISTLAEAPRAVFFGAVGVLVLMVVASDELLATGGGTLVWIGLIALAVVAIIRVWSEAHTY
jgi:hypothetical protein